MKPKQFCNLSPIRVKRESINNDIDKNIYMVIKPDNAGSLSKRQSKHKFYIPLAEINRND